MTKGELVRAVAESRGMKLRDSRAVFEALVGSIERALTEGQPVTIREFGTFRVERRNGRKIRLPLGGVTVEMPARLAPVFHGADALGRRLAPGQADSRRRTPARTNTGAE